MTTEIGREKEQKLKKICEYDLARLGWNFFPFVGQNSFSIYIENGKDPEKALAEGGGIYAWHKELDWAGEERPGGHFELLEMVDFLPGRSALVTKPDSEIDHYIFTVLVQKKSGQ